MYRSSSRLVISLASSSESTCRIPFEAFTSLNKVSLGDGLILPAVRIVAGKFPERKFFAERGMLDLRSRVIGLTGFAACSGTTTGCVTVKGLS